MDAWKFAPTGGVYMEFLRACQRTRAEGQPIAYIVGPTPGSQRSESE